MTLRYEVSGEDVSLAGSASKELKKSLTRLGLDSACVKRAVIAMYEAEINMVVHAGGGVATAAIGPDRILIELEDHGPGIPDIELAMKEGYSTAPPWVRDLGFGAGMGLPNIKRNADDMTIDSVVGRGTTVRIVIALGGKAGT